MASGSLMGSFDAESLARAGRELPVPFRLAVRAGPNAEPSEITVTEILRLLPGRRVAAIAQNGGEEFFIKVFVGPSARHYWRREIRGVAAMEAAGVRTPGVLWQGALADGGHAVAFEYIRGATSLADQWGAADTALRDSVMALLARLHGGGVAQNDIHPDNFLIRGEEIFMVDGGDIARKGNSALGRRKTLRNLALFFAQFHDSREGAIDWAFERYCKHRGWACDRKARKALNEHIKLSRNVRKHEFVRKAFRECTRFSCSRSFRRFQVCERRYSTPGMAQLLGRLDAAMAAGKTIKDGNTATVAVIESPLGPLAVKRYNMKNPLHRLLRAPRKSRAWISWANAYRLQFLGINTLQPIALVEDRFGPLRGKAWLVTRYEEGIDATHLPDVDKLDETMESMVRILKELHAAGITHGDLKASNFLLGEGGVKLIDLDAMIDHSRTTRLEAAFRKDLERFMQNWRDTPRLEQGFGRLISVSVGPHISPGA